MLERPEGLVGIEVKATERAKPALSRSAHSFIDAYAPARFLVVSLGPGAQATVGGTRVTWIGPEGLAAAVFGAG